MHPSEKTMLRIVAGDDAYGVVIQELQMSSRLRALGHATLHLVVGQGEFRHRLASKGFPVLELDDAPVNFTGSAHRKIANLFRNAEWARRAGRAISHDIPPGSVALVNVLRPELLTFAGIVGRRCGAPVFWHLPNLVSPKYFGVARAVYWAICRRYRIQPIANSRHTARSLGFGDYPIVYPGFDPARLDDPAGGEAAAFREKLGQGTPLYAVFARITPDKAQDIVLQAFLESEAFAAGAHLLFVGGCAVETDHAFLDRVERLAAERGQDRVHLVGPREDVGAWYRITDIAVNGRRNAEPFGISIAEALASGIPVIAYGPGGPEEMIRDGETGWLVWQPSVIAYREAFNLSYRARGRWRQMGAQAQTSVQRFALDVQVEEYLRVTGQKHPSMLLAEDPERRSVTAR